MKPVYSLAVLGLLTACGPMVADNGAGKLSASIAAMVSRGQPAAAVEAPAVTLQSLREAEVPSALMAVPSVGWSGIVQQIGQNGDAITWGAIGGYSVTTENGLVIATRGFGNDLMAADPGNVLSAIRNGGGETTRVVEYLTGTDHIAKADLACSIEARGQETVQIIDETFEANRFEETCQNDQIGFMNVYWTTANGQVVQSQQWLSFSLGHITTQMVQTTDHSK